MMNRVLDAVAGAVLPRRRAAACYRNPTDWFQCISGTYYHCYTYCSGATQCFVVGSC